LCFFSFFVVVKDHSRAMLAGRGGGWGGGGGGGASGAVVSGSRVEGAAK